LRIETTKSGYFSFRLLIDIAALSAFAHLEQALMSFSFSFARGCACISKIKSTMADKIYRAGRVSCASSQPNILFLGIARSDRYKPITTTPMIGQSQAI